MNFVEHVLVELVEHVLVEYVKKLEIELRLSLVYNPGH